MPNLGLQAQGATRVICAATGTGIAFAKSMGADVVVDYTKDSVYDAAPNGSIDVARQLRHCFGLFLAHFQAT